MSAEPVKEETADSVVHIHSQATIQERSPQLLDCPNCSVTLDLSDFDADDSVACPLCQHRIDVPRAMLGHYSLMEEVGRGAVGAVYRAMDLELGREVAIKILPRETEENTGYLQAIRREARAAAAINHPNVMQVYAVGHEMEIPYLVMEFLPSPHVENMILEEGILSEEQSLLICWEIAKGLAAAHEENVIHGDVKPANMMLNRAGIAKLVDFGEATSADDQGKAELWGTPYYLAPECVTGSKATEKSDQYSLGAALFRMVSGHFAFNGHDVAEVLENVKSAPLPNARDFNKSVSIKTSSVLRKMMQRDPAKRYTDMDAVVKELEDAHRAVILMDKFHKTAGTQR